MLARLQLAPELRFSIASLVNYVILGLMVLLGLSIIGINLSVLTVLFGVLGIGLGFGMQSVVANFVAGVVIIFERPLTVGDRILVDGLEADVVSIRLRSTIVVTPTNETIVLPNSLLVDSKMHNYSHNDRSILVTNTVSVAYETDLDQVKEVLLRVGSTSPFGDGRRAPVVRATEFGDSGIEMELWTPIATQRTDVTPTHGLISKSGGASRRMES